MDDPSPASRTAGGGGVVVAASERDEGVDAVVLAGDEFVGVQRVGADETGVAGDVIAGAH